MADALTFTIELPDGKYASVNRLQRSQRDPRKSPIYKAVYAAVLEAARRERDRIGWEAADCECLAEVMRVLPARWRADAMNLGKPEMERFNRSRHLDRSRASARPARRTRPRHFTGPPLGRRSRSDIGASSPTRERAKAASLCAVLASSSSPSGPRKARICRIALASIRPSHMKGCYGN